MTLGKLGKQIARELRQNPKKGVILAGMCVVALYYWVPILRRWSSDKTPATATTASATAPEQQTTVTSRRGARRRWEEVAKAIDGDPQMQPVDVGLAWNPFATADETEQKEELETTPPESVTATAPQEAGLQLQSTIVGKHRQTAVINGVAYSTGNWVVAPNDTNIRYRLLEITEDAVILERHGQRYTLALDADEMWASHGGAAQEDASEESNGPP